MLSGLDPVTVPPKVVKFAEKYNISEAELNPANHESQVSYIYGKANPS